VLFEGGMFINIRNTALPDEKFDLIFAAIETDITYLHRILDKYPGAKVYGLFKEATGNPQVRAELIGLTRGYIQPYLTYDMVDTGRIPLIKIPQPINIDYLRNRFLGKKQMSMFDYSNYWASGRHADNKPFIDKAKARVPVLSGITKSTDQNQILDFFNLWKDCCFMVNFDRSYSFGQMATQCAALNTVILGGNNDSHFILFPTCTGMDVDFVYNDFDRMMTDEFYLKDTIQYANYKLQELYSFNAVRQRILELL
jgi:hypothetical protein